VESHLAVTHSLSDQGMVERRTTSRNRELNVSDRPSQLTDSLRESAPLEVKALANQLLDWADSDGIAVTPLKLQKLIFFCHADYLLQFGQPLVRQSFEAWNYGPVIPSIYEEFQELNSQPIKHRATAFNVIYLKRCEVRQDISKNIKETVFSFYQFYRTFSAGQLSDLSHVAGGPWRQARSLFCNGLNIDRRISDEMILEFHRLPHN
jgi:uncharacterized phage-associated protein